MDNLSKAIYCLVRTMARHLIYRSQGEARRELEEDLEIVEDAWQQRALIQGCKQDAKRFADPQQ